LNGPIQPFQQPKRVIGFSLLPDVTLLTCAQISRSTRWLVRFRVLDLQAQRLSPPAFREAS